MVEEVIVVFDSGVGGLTVLHEAMTILPYEHYLYYADVANVPYGTKSKPEIKYIILEAIANLSQQFSIKALVMACNTGTSAAIENLRNTYTFPIIGMEPAIKPAISLSSGKNIMVWATALTIREDKFQNLVANLDSNSQVVAQAMGPLVQFAEDFDFSSDKLHDFLVDSIEHVNWENYQALVLGCTHFVFYKDILKDYLPSHIKVIDGNQGTSNQLKRLITASNNRKRHPITVLLSGMEVDQEFIMPYMDRLKSLSRAT